MDRMIVMMLVMMVTVIVMVMLLNEYYYSYYDEEERGGQDVPCRLPGAGLPCPDPAQAMAKVPTLFQQLRLRPVPFPGTLLLHHPR